MTSIQCCDYGCSGVVALLITCLLCLCVTLCVCVLQLITAKLGQVGSNMPSSPDSSSDSSTGSPHNNYDGPNIEAENCLPGVVSG